MNDSVAARQHVVNGEDRSPSRPPAGDAFTTLLAQVDADGTVCNPVVLRSTNPALNDPAIAHLLGLKFQPGTRDSKPERMKTNMGFSFDRPDTAGFAPVQAWMRQENRDTAVDERGKRGGADPMRDPDDGGLSDRRRQFGMGYGGSAHHRRPC